MRNTVFNVGSTAENYTKKMLVDLILERLPKTVVEYVKRESDPRDYRVQFAKIERELGFGLRWSVPDGMDEVIGAIREGIITDYTRKEYRN